MICASESVAFVHKDIYDEFVKKLKEYTVYFASKEEQEKLSDYMFKTHKGAANVK
jgi:acyl-CoA reductase-like NAD-dependent aldehyde dehydrogenase